MPTRAEHLAQARSNQRFTAAIDAAIYPDWAIASMFYEAVHLIRAWLADRGEEDIRSHGQIRDLLLAYHFPHRFRAIYHDLETLSRDARYECLHPDELIDDLPDARSYLGGI